MSAPVESRPAPTQPGLSEADRLAHELASFVRAVEPTPDLPPLPTEPAERRRVMQLRGW
ncbi:hypothetical protein AB0E62_34250 [Streptomyces sp. NPDC038707]|uniref:hypothetical protein n=1 Tax=Streptomyces sp. NPDC038707 TaxID=3154329 RepID=UPI0033CCC5C3